MGMSFDYNENELLEKLKKNYKLATANIKYVGKYWKGKI